MITISLCMIVKNEEAILARCLDSIISLVDEIIIVDTGSTDATKEIAFQYTDKVYDFTWCDDFSKARNFSFSKATCTYCMWLDADDVILEKDQILFKELKHSLTTDISMVMMRYHTSFDQEGNSTFTYYRERLLRRDEHYLWEGFIHEVIPPRGTLLYSDVAITHQKDKPGDANRNLLLYEIKKEEGFPFSSRDLFYYARELYYHAKYQEAISTFHSFLEREDGWIENQISACQLLSECYRGIDEKEKALFFLFSSFSYDTPRAEICCDIGKHFLETQKYEQAIYWYEVATTCKRNDQSGAFVLVDCYDFIPYLQLCVCYDALQDYQKAYTYNELAGKCKPSHPSYLYNKKYFESKKHLR